MKKKLEETGKRCSYKNYDLLPTKVNTLIQVVISLIVVIQFFLIATLPVQPVIVNFKLRDLFAF